MAGMKTASISNPELGHFLKRTQRIETPSYDFDLGGTFLDILRRANDFVPSEAGSIVLEEPPAKEGSSPKDLVIVACFGENAERLAGTRLPAHRGIASHVKLSGRAYLSANPAEDPLFYGEIDATTSFSTRSILCVPLRLDGEVVGVLELLNHLGDQSYSEKELDLLELFGQTISAWIGNAVEAQRSREMAQRDDLTGLFNDRYMHHRLTALIDRCLETGENCGLIFLDLDHFKSINDRHGHLIGSRVLHEVGLLLRRILPGHSIAARYGGDEFVILLPDVTSQETFWTAETIRKSIEGSIFLERADPLDSTIYPALMIQGVVTCSLGLSTLRDDVLPIFSDQEPPNPLAIKNELMRVADHKMYQAKEQGKNRTVT